MSTRFWLKPKVQLVGDRSPFSRIGGFPSLKPEPPALDQNYIQNPIKFGKVKPDLTRSWPNPVRSWPNLVWFSQIRSNHSKFQPKILNSSDELQFPTNFSTNRTDLSSTWTRNWFDQLTSAVYFTSLRLPPDAGGSGPGWVQNWPSSTNEHA